MIFLIFAFSVGHVRNNLSHFLFQAFAEELHERVRRELWGYCSDECLKTNEMHKIKYEVIYLTQKF